jgi:hypothetical protein
MEPAWGQAARAYRIGFVRKSVRLALSRRTIGKRLEGDDVSTASEHNTYIKRRPGPKATNRVFVSRCLCVLGVVQT